MRQVRADSGPAVRAAPSLLTGWLRTLTSGPHTTVIKHQAIRRVGSARNLGEPSRGSSRCGRVVGTMEAKTHRPAWKTLSAFAIIYLYGDPHFSRFALAPTKFPRSCSRRCGFRWLALLSMAGRSRGASAHGMGANGRRYSYSLYYWVYGVRVADSP